jgi:hypothetical protein
MGFTFREVGRSLLRREITSRAREIRTGDNDRMSTPGLVGREEPLGRLSRALDETISGIGRLVLISGEPGVGKTRLALEALDSAARRGARTAVGACWDGGGAPGLWPWVQVLRSLRAEIEPGHWDRATQSGRGAVTRLLDADDSDDPTEFHLLEAILQLLTAVCEERPFVVVLDDLQWADPPSVELMEFLHRHAVHLPFLMIGTYRVDELGRLDHPVRDRLADLAQKAVTIPLAGLDNDGIRAVRAQFGVTTSTAEAEHLRRLTGGNPFFVIESVAFTEPTESLGVRRAVDRRVDALDEVDRRVLTVGSLVGREVGDPLLAVVVGDGTDAALAAVEQAGLMVAEDGRHVFVHDLVRETMRDRLSSAERRELEATIVDAADDPVVRDVLLPAQLAWLAVDAVPMVDARRAVRLLEDAAADALARLTFEEAGRHLEAAADLAADTGARARLTLESAHAYERAGALGQARDRYSSLTRADEVETRARALLGLHRLGDRAALGGRSEVVRMLDEIDAELSRTADTRLRAQVLAARARSRSHLLDEDRTDAVTMAEQALELARSGDDEGTIESCVLAYHDALWAAGTERERGELGDELAAAGRARSDASLEAQGLLLRMVSEIERGDGAYRATHRRFDAVAEASRSPRLQFVAASRRGAIAALRADLGNARREIDAAKELGERIGEPDAVGMWCDQRWQVARHAGDTDTIAELLATLRDMGDPHWLVYEAMVAADLGDVERARWVKPQALELGRRWPRWAARLWDAFNTDLAILERDDTAIAELLERLEPDAGHWAVLGGGVIVHGPVSLRLGRLEAARGHWESALEWAVEAESEAVRLDAVLWQLEAATDRLTAQHSLGAVDDHEVTSLLASVSERGLDPLAGRLQPLTSPSATQPANAFRLDGDVWTLGFAGVEVLMPDAKGLRDLHTLLANPGVDVPATALATDAVVSSDAPPVLDARAKEAYRRRLDDLDEALDRAGRRGDAAKAEVLEHERQALIVELRRATGLGGRDRTMHSDRERIRKTVTARIRDTLRRLDDRHPALSAHLRASVRTGALCTYAPSEPPRWDLGPSMREEGAPRQTA